MNVARALPLLLRGALLRGARTETSREPLEPAPCLVVSCSEFAAGAALGGHLQPAQTLIEYGGLLSGWAEGGLDQARATVEYATGICGVRSIVAVGHSCCTAEGPGRLQLRTSAARSQVNLSIALATLRRIVGGAEVCIHGVWVDEAERRLFRVDERGRLAPMSDAGLARLLAEIFGARADA